MATSPPYAILYRTFTRFEITSDIQTWMRVKFTQGRAKLSLRTVFLLAVLIPQLALALLGWALLRERLDAGRHRRKIELERAADQVVHVLQARLQETQTLLDTPEKAASLIRQGDAVLVRISNNALFVTPNEPLPYVPMSLVRLGDEAPKSVFHRIDRLHRERRDNEAATICRAMAAVADPRIRAGALIRLARSCDRLGRFEAALTALGAASAITGVAVEGFPSELLARLERSELLARSGRPFGTEVASLRADLLSGKWRIPLAIFHESMSRLHSPRTVIRGQTYSKWLYGDHGAGMRELLATADALTSMAVQIDQPFHSAPRPIYTGVEEEGKTVLHASAGPNAHAVLVAGREFLRTNWLSALESIEQKYEMRVSVRRHRENPPTGVRRTRQDTHLPWDVLVRDVRSTTGLFHPADLSSYGFLGTAVLLSLGLYMIAHSVYRELAVSRRQADFVAAVSHEVRTPLTSIRQVSEMLVDGRTGGPGRQSEYYEALLRQSRRLERTVDHLLRFGQLEAGVRNKRLAVVDVRELVRKVVAEFRGDSAAREHCIEIGLEDGTDLTIEGDSGALENALWNVLDNAAKYSLSDRPIRIELSRGSRRGKQSVSISVTDEGIGIPGHEQRRVFREFIRGCGPVKDGVEGYGMGLAIVKNIVIAHEGKVVLQSATGKGTTLKMMFPAHRPSQGRVI